MLGESEKSRGPWGAARAGLGPGQGLGIITDQTEASLGTAKERFSDSQTEADSQRLLPRLSCE